MARRITQRKPKSYGADSVDNRGNTDIRTKFRAVNSGSTDPHAGKFANFICLGREVVFGKEALHLVSSVRGRLIVCLRICLQSWEEFSVIVAPRRESLDALHSHFGVQIADPISVTVLLDDMTWRIQPQVKNPKWKKGLHFTDDD